MSLKDLAQQMKSRGRNGDTELIHMTKGEVAGLQQLAEAAGGTLTINPDTGLPEASFLEKLISSPLFAPLAGAGLMMIPGVGPMMAAGLVGGGTALATGDVGKGAMAGLGAYGGAGIGAGLNTAGTAAAGAAATPSAEIAASQALADTARTSVGASASGLPFTGAEADVIRNQAMGAEYLKATDAFKAQPFFDRVGQGIQALGDAGGRTAFMDGVGGLSGLAKSGAMGLAPMMLAGMGNRGAAEMPGEEEDDEDLFGRYEYRANPTGGVRQAGAPLTSEARYFDPEFRPRFTAAQGGAVKKFADGGEASAPTSDFDPARGMTGQSAESMRYLYDMGQGPGASGQALDYLYGQTPAVTRAVQAPTEMPAAGPTQRYIFNPSTGMFLNNPAYVPPRSKDESRGRFGMGQSGEDFAGRDSHLNSFGFPGSFAEGGITDLAEGGFVVPADVVSMAGEGNTEAGYERIRRTLPGATPIKGRDGGQADTVKTSIEGKQPARVAHGEMYVPPETVKRAGGAKKLYAMMDKVREQATGNKKQIKPVNIKKALA
jgi:hypothetical protein